MRSQLIEDILMNKYLIIALFLIFPATIWSANWKVIESSSKNTPGWLRTTSNDYIVVEVERSNLEEAKKAAESELIQQIISAVAINVESSSQAGVNEERNGDSNRSSEYFIQQTQTASAKLPFLKGISIARAMDTYWELREEKNTKRKYAVFAVQYPLSVNELDEMYLEFKNIDARKTQELNSLKERLSLVDSTMEIGEALTELQALKEYFFDNSRIAETDGLIKSYKNLYKGLSLQCSIDTLRKQALVSVMLNGRKFKSGILPKVTSNCATEIEVSHSEDGLDYIIKYNDNYCIDGEDNYLDVNLRLEGNRLQSKIYF